MKSILLACWMLVIFSVPALAGPNAGGAIIVHTKDWVVTSQFPCTIPAGQPASCEEAVTQATESSPALQMVWFLAAFPPEAVPDVAGIYFGTDVDETNLEVGTHFGFCGPEYTVQAADDEWPYDAGCSVGFGTPIAGSTLFRFYCFAVECYDADPAAPNPWWCSAPNPTGGYAAFYSSSYPPAEDLVHQFGCVKWYEPGSNQCPGSLPIGACCDTVTGDCVITVEYGCPAPEIWHPEWTSCDTNPCPQPPPQGACCDPANGSCQLTTEAACLPPRIWHEEWTSCSPNPCPVPPVGACCDPSTAACLLTPEASCLSPRIWHPEWTTCSPNPCPPPPTGACCNPPTGSCQITTQAGCSSPRIWHPEWTTCLPNPCPQPPTGACCYPSSGSCVITIQATCISPGIWHPEWTTCVPNPCPQPPEQRACCWPNGVCDITLEANCPPPAVWHPEFATCYPNPCPWTPSGPNANGSIVVHTNDAYSFSASTVCTTTLGLPASCEEAITRSDKATGAVVWFLAAFPPTSMPAVAGIYFGVNMDETNLAIAGGYGFCGPEGTAEAPDAGWPSNTAGDTVAFGSSIAGQILFRFYYFVVDETSGAPGPYFCSAVNPTGGYAAFYDPSLPPYENPVVGFGCVKWYEQGHNECPQTSLPSGACCDPVTGACAFLTQAECPAPYTWLESQPCNPNPCPMMPPPIGVCCYPDGTCLVTEQDQCPPLCVWHPDWSSCNPNPCPATPPPSSAACCTPYGDCTLTSESECQAPDYWLPEWQTCDPNPCGGPTRTEKTSWGKIKALYR